MEQSKFPLKKNRKSPSCGKKRVVRHSCFKDFFMPIPKRVTVTSFTGNLEL